jgi:hypothetical protein
MQPTPRPPRGLRGFPDLRTSEIAEKYIRRGLYHGLRAAPVAALIPIAASLVLELLNLAKNGELIRLWAVASQTDLTFNLVRPDTSASSSAALGDLRPAATDVARAAGL